jgi:hypothetical protein
VAVAEAWRVGELYHSPRDEQRGAVLIAHTLRRTRCYAVHIIPQFELRSFYRKDFVEEIPVPNFSGYLWRRRKSVRSFA